MHSALVASGAAGSIGLAIALTSSSAAAQPRPLPPATAADAAEASRLFQEGLECTRRGEHDKAATAFDASYRKRKNPNALFNLAASEDKSGRHVHSIAIYEEFVDASVRDNGDPEFRAKANAALVTLKTQVCVYRVVGPPEMVASINGVTMKRELGYAEPGVVSVTLVVGADTRKRESTCKAGDNKEAYFDDKVTVVPTDGKASTTTDAGKITGLHVPEPLKNTTTERSSGYLYAAVGTGVVGIGGLVLGGVFGAQSNSADATRAELARAQPGRCAIATSVACAPVQTAVDDASSKHTLSVVSFVIGGAMLGATAALTALYVGSSREVEAPPQAPGAIASHKPKPKSKLSPSVHVAPTTNGLVAFGQF
jgi:hypothetical protein